MTFDEIVKIADKAYPDGITPEYMDGDGLAEFIYCELKETYDAGAPEEDQVMEAVRVMQVARRQLEAVEDAFLDKLMGKGKQ